MLTKETPIEIKASLKIKAMGVENTLQLTYHNFDADKYEELQRSIVVPEDAKSTDDVIRSMGASLALHLVKSFDDGTDKAFPLTYDGLMDLERTWPGTMLGIVKGYHQARGATVEKN